MPYPDNYSETFAPDRAPTESELALERVGDDADDCARRAREQAVADAVTKALMQHIVREGTDEAVVDIVREAIAEQVEGLGDCIASHIEWRVK